MDQQVKNIQVTAPATSGGGTRKRRPSRQPPKGGGSTSAGTIDQLGASSAPGWSSADAVPKMEISVPSGAPLSSAFSEAGAGAGAGAGGGRATKVVLTKKHKPKVILGAPHVIRHKAPVAARQKTRKTNRINISLSGLTKKMTRANKIKKESKGMDIAVIKKVLVKAGLVKETTKAPDGILRQMYEDYAVIKNRAL